MMDIAETVVLSCELILVLCCAVLCPALPCRGVLQVWPTKYGGGREGVGRLITCIAELLLVPLNTPGKPCGKHTQVTRSASQGMPKAPKNMAVCVDHVLLKAVLATPSVMCATNAFCINSSPLPCFPTRQNPRL